jgi:hydroxyacylglutathione hydrolase/adenylyltransferase/sulfurtransferase
MSAPEDSPMSASAEADERPRDERPLAAPVDPSEIGVDPAQLEEWLARDPELQIVDVREAYEREAGHVAGSRHIELVQLSGRAGELDGEHPIVFYCRVGARSEMAAQAFRASGLQAHSMRGGLVRWAAEGRPLEPDGGRVADH